MKEKHVLLLGDSGSGKTTVMREMHQTADEDVSIWVNTNSERVSGTTVTSLSELDAEVSRGTRLIDYQATSAGLQAIQEARSVAYHSHNGLTQILVDESHNWLPDGKVEEDNPLANGLKEDRDEGIKWVVADQDPTELEYSPLKQCRYLVWVGIPSAYHDGFRRYFSLKKSQFPTSRYQYVVWEKTEPFEWGISYTGSTKEKYA